MYEIYMIYITYIYEISSLLQILPSGSSHLSAKGEGEESESACFMQQGCFIPESKP